MIVAVPVIVVGDEPLAPLPGILFICPRNMTSPVIGCSAATCACVYIASLGFTSRTIRYLAVATVFVRPVPGVHSLGFPAAVRADVVPALVFALPPQPATPNTASPTSPTNAQRACTESLPRYDRLIPAPHATTLAMSTDGPRHRTADRQPTCRWRPFSGQ